MPRSKPSLRLPSSTSKKLPLATPSEAAFERLLAGFENGEPDEADAAAESSSATPASPAAAFLEGLFAKSAAYLERDRFAFIGEASEFHTKVVGVSFEGRQDVVAGLEAGLPLELVREPDNSHDPNAIQVRFGRLQLGFLRREIARRLAPNVDSGVRYSATIASVTGGGAKNVGVNVLVRRERERRGRPASAAREGEASAGELRDALIGRHPLRESQRAVLERLAAGRNTLAVLGTGRGKSLCFQLPAAERALARGEKTLVFYPLRALANDQFNALTRRFDRFGLRVLRANGAIDGEERAALQEALEDGSWDIILTTPEFAYYHRAAFERDANRPQLVVVDEAHHLFESRHRSAYAALGSSIEALGAPQVLALTATANDDAFREMCRVLRIDAWVIDPTVRENLHVVDARNVKDKTAYLREALAGDGKAIVYCNSRAECTKVAERLRTAFGPSVAFYHAGVPAAERSGVEDLFRRGEIRVVVATSAFGEGIDLPDVRDVVIYHLNFDFTEFNQQAGRAGRDGLDARIHLLYGDGDRKINDYILARGAPSLALLRELYRAMRGLASFDVVRMTYEDVARTLDLEMADGRTVAAAVAIFEEGGLVTTGIDDEGRFVRFREVAGKVDLTRTARFAEGEAERDGFERFCSLALEAEALALEQIVNRPIYPDRVPHLR